MRIAEVPKRVTCHTTEDACQAIAVIPPRAHRASLGCKSLSDPNRSIAVRVRVRVRVRVGVRVRVW